MKRSLCRDNNAVEKEEQAVKLIVRTIVEIGSTRPESLAANGTGIVPLSEPVRSLIAIAEHRQRRGVRRW